MGKPEGKKPLGRPRHRWIDIRMDLGEIVGWCGLEWSGTGTGSVKRWETIEWPRNWWPLE
jgi:hypothetical protein